MARTLGPGTRNQLARIGWRIAAPVLLVASSNGWGQFVACPVCDSTRANPADAIEILRNTWSTTLDPAQTPPEKRLYGSKALINACKDHRHLSSFSKRTMLRKRIDDTEAARWRELGLPGDAPVVLAYEPEDAPTKN